MEENSSLSVPEKRFSDDNKTLFKDFPKELIDFTGSCFIILAIVGTVGNVISIAALYRSKKLKNATTIFIINLAVADLLFCSISMPLSAASYFQRNWNYGHVTCVLFALLRYWNAILSVFSVVAITINRYIHVLHPHLYNYLYSGSKIYGMIAFTWLSSFAMLLPPLFGIWGKLGYSQRMGICNVIEKNGRSPRNFYYITFAFALPAIVFLVCYIRIYRVAHTSRKNIKSFGDNINSAKSENTSTINRKNFAAQEKQQAQKENKNKSDMRVLRMMLIIFITYIVCYIPLSIVKVFKIEFKLPGLYAVGIFAAFLSNVINPIIYVALSTKYRKAYKDLFCPNSAQTSFSDTT